MIEQALQYINRSQKKKTLLIIEDLDRIDPAHLFRILNVLGAHLDFCNQRDIKPNKFGFDNIVTVFDYEITSHLFHHFMGKKPIIMDISTNLLLTILSITQSIKLL